MKNVESVVFFGKGGIGKSTLASNVSSILAAGGGKVLHIGCDPKMDSTLALAGRHIPPFSGSPGPDAEARLRGFIQPAAVKGVYCVEAGGPQAGVGCAGAGIGALLETIKGAGILEQDGYTAAVFDVLGDVVCGGFAAPLRRGFAKKVVIVTSEDILSLYSANRLILMVQNFARNGVWLAGLAVNCRDAAGAKTAAEFAAAVNARVLGVIPRDKAVAAAERRRVPAALAYPKSAFAGAAVRLALAISGAVPQKKPPRAMSDAEFSSFIAGRAPAARPAPAAAKKTTARPRIGVAAALLNANLKPAGIEGGQILCDRPAAGGVARIVLARAGSGTAGWLQISDWAACIHPSSAVKAAGELNLADAVSGLGGYTFGELLEYFGVGGSFYETIGSLGDASNFSDNPAAETGAAPRRPHMGAGQWYRFLFPPNLSGLVIPPDLTVVEHGDSECRFCDSSGGPLGFFGTAAGAPLALAKERSNVFSTDFGTVEALAGDGALVKRSLEAAAAVAGPGGLVEFYTTCGPMLLAGDTASEAEAVEKKYGVKIQRENYNSYEEYSRVKAGARSALIGAGIARLKKAGARPVFDAAFFRYPESGRLRSLLESAGIKAAPEGQDFYAALVSARLIVLPAYDAALCPALDGAGIKWLVPSRPYGFAGTKACLTEIFLALGLAPSGVPEPSPAQLELRKELALRARSFSAGLVAEPQDIDAIAGGELAYGLPLAAEAGFGLRLLVRLDDKAGRQASAKAAGALSSALKARSFETVFFSSPAELERLLARPEGMRLVYSDLLRDPRVLAAGKNPFSSKIFEPGYDGALESARRLLELCDWNFSRKYLAGTRQPPHKA